MQQNSPYFKSSQVIRLFFLFLSFNRPFLIFLMEKILIIQTAFIGDVILATVVIEKLKAHFPLAKIDFLVRKGNESLLQGHPLLNEVLIWNKKENKKKNLLRMIFQIRKKKYDVLINLQRYFSTGLLTVFSNAKKTIGFDKNPLSMFFHQSIKHQFEIGTHEVNRNLSLIKKLTDSQFIRPKLYPQEGDFESVLLYKKKPYICIAPTSVWFTKQWHESKWIELLNQIDEKYKIFLLGSPQDMIVCERIKNESSNTHIEILAGKLTLLESAALMRDAVMNYVNDSAPMHLASAMNAPTCVIYCSTVPSFGYGPLAENAHIIQLEEALPCRPCGIHGHKSCPQKHFKCAMNIEIRTLLKALET